MTRTNFEFGQSFQFGNPVADSTATCSYLSESSTMSCPSSAASSRRSSEISFANSSTSFSCFTPGTPPISTIAFEDFQQINPLIAFSSSRLPFCGKEGVALEMFQYMPPSAMSFESVNISGENMPHEYSVSSTQCFEAQMAEARALEVDRIRYPKDIGTVLPDETTASMPPYLRSSPSLVVPSQMPVNLHSQADPIPDPCRGESPEEVAQESVIDSYFQSKGNVVAVELKLSDTHMTSTRRNRSHHQQTDHPGSRDRPGMSTKAPLEQSSHFHVRALKPECTRATATISKKFKCLLCDKGFDRQEHYKRHLVSESHETILARSEKRTPEPPAKTYPCPACNKAFNRKDNLKPHYKTHLWDEGGKHHRNQPPVTIEQSIRYGWAHLDPRITNGNGDEGGRGKKRIKR